MLRERLRKPHEVFSTFFFDPWDMLKRWRGLYHFAKNALSYSRRKEVRALKITLRDILYRSYDRYKTAGSVPMHYFLQDNWAARYIYNHKITRIIDIGSRLDGFIAHVLTFCDVTYVDIRPMDVKIDRLEFIRGDITSLPFDSGSVENISCLHVIEHIGLGRYGDPVDPSGHLKAATEMCRVLAPGGTLLLSTVLGRERLCFDAHRIFSMRTLQQMFKDLKLDMFCLIDDKGQEVLENATIQDAEACSYGCGIFIFKKQLSPKA